MAISGKHSLLRWGISAAFSLLIGTACSNSTTHRNDDPQNDGFEVAELAKGLNHPWGMVFLPDGRLLITERAGDLRIMDKNNNLSDPVEGVPEVLSRGQGGLLDVALDPGFENNNYIYLSFAEPGQGGASTALGRGRFQNDRISDFTVIFRQEPKVDGNNHFGGRIVFSPDGKYIFLTMGERFKFDPAQDLSNHLGAIVRLNPDGSVPQDNPFVGQENAADEIWSYGHRNIEAAAFDADGKLWVVEMGPKGGDELNQPRAGENYGWPVVSWGVHYDGREIPDPPTKPEFVDAVIHWTPVISPSGMAYYESDMFPEFRGNFLVGGLSAQGIIRIKINGDKAEEVGRLDLGARIREVEQAPDGSIYALTDENNGKVLRLTPAD